MMDGGEEMAIQFKPDENNTRMLRDAFSRFISGVTVVTAPSEQGPVGITANSFSSLSLSPPLVLWSPAIDSRRYVFFEKAEYFAIHILEANQKDICNKPPRICLLYTSPSPRDRQKSRMPASA